MTLLLGVSCLNQPSCLSSTGTHTGVWKILYFFQDCLVMPSYKLYNPPSVDSKKLRKGCTGKVVACPSRIVAALSPRSSPFAHTRARGSALNSRCVARDGILVNRGEARP